MEIFFLGNFFEFNNWDYSELSIYSEKAPDFLNHIEVQDINEYHSLVLYLIFTAYSIKVFI